jgi:ABC-type phosphate transport system substrate-binding protein
MGIYNQARRWAVAVVCTAGAVAGLSVAAPGAASAACITGSGSSLQAEQQTKWTGLFVPVCGAIEYTSTGSGKGLKEFGIEGTELLKTESGNGTKLDAYIGTDDAPTLTELGKTNGGGLTAETTAWTAPVVAAPIAVIVHLPSTCKINKTVTVTGANLSKAFAGEAITWAELFGAGNVEGTCTGKPMRDVRSDGSGTSFAFKQYLCQVEAAVWGTGGECESGDGFVVDAATWPAGTEAALLKHLNKESVEVENEGSKGVVEAVENEEGSIGYVNLANAAAGGKFVLSVANATKFWVNVETSGKSEDPEKGTKEGNCPTSYTFPTMAIETEAKEGMWAKVHFASPSTVNAYPICTFTYDIGWENYKTTKLEVEYAGKGTEVGEAAKEYFEYMTSATEGQLKASIKEYYAPLPTGAKSVRAIAEEIAVNHVG